MPATRSPRSHSLREPSLLGSYLACGVSALRVSIACADAALTRLAGARPPLPSLGEGIRLQQICSPHPSFRGATWRRRRIPLRTHPLSQTWERVAALRPPGEGRSRKRCEPDRAETPGGRLAG